MTEREFDLAKRTSDILDRDTMKMTLNDIIEQLVEVIENGTSEKG